MRIRQWLEDCTTTHSRCHLSISGSDTLRLPTLPTRVIDLGGMGLDVKIVSGEGIQANYVALSHCWGGASLIRTMTANLEKFHQRIFYQTLSKTIQEAIYVTRVMNLRYLWVDSLCIIQDDQEDWLREAKTMASVYEGAYFTIAATASKNGNEGLFPSRTSQSLVKLPCDPNHLADGYMMFGLKNDNGPSLVFEEPLNTRAWVYQERMFSRRTLHFASEQMYWECGNRFIAEDMHVENDPRSRTLHTLPMRSLLCYHLTSYSTKMKETARYGSPSVSYGMNEDFHSIWASGILFYTRCGLTKASDKLPALYSLAKTLESLTHHQYHEGHWFDDTKFPLTGLLWHPATDARMNKVEPLRAPSWSWASLDGPIKYLDFRNWWAVTFHPHHLEMKFLRVETFQPLGMKSVKALLLEATKIPCTRFTCPYTSAKNPVSKLNKLVSNRGELIEGNFEFDVEEDQPYSFWLVPVYVRFSEPSKPIFFVIMVSEVPGQKKGEFIFRRVGCGFAYQSSWLCDRKRGFMVIV